jgi:caa(3)-type oxidase subunit IV
MSIPTHDPNPGPAKKQSFDRPVMPSDDPGIPDAGEKGHPNYTLVFLALGVFTALEIAASYLPIEIRLPTLVVLALIKASLVVLFFMHLRYDNRLYALPLIIGIVLAIPIIVTILLGLPTPLLR